MVGTPEPSRDQIVLIVDGKRKQTQPIERGGIYDPNGTNDINHRVKNKRTLSLFDLPQVSEHLQLLNPNTKFLPRSLTNLSFFH